MRPPLGARARLLLCDGRVGHINFVGQPSAGYGIAIILLAAMARPEWWRGRMGVAQYAARTDCSAHGERAL